MSELPDNIEYALDETSVGFEVPDKWSVARISSITDSSLYGLSESALDFDSEIPRYIRVTDLRKRRNELKNESPKSMSSEKAKDRPLQKGDLLFARSGASRGKTHLVTENTNNTYGGYLIRYRIDTDSVSPWYLLQYTKSDRYLNWVERVARGGGQDNISANEYNDCLIPVPPLVEQERIASVLYVVDQHVAHLDQRHSRLHDLKHALMQDLLTGEMRFNEDGVELPSEEEFCGYRLEEEPSVVLANWSGMKIPDGWTREKISENINLTTGDSFSSERFNDEGEYILIKNKTVKTQKPETYIDSPIEDRYVVESGDLLVTMDGEFTPREWKEGKAALNQRVCKIEPNKTFNKRFLRYALEYPLSRIQDYKAGTTVKHLSSNDFSDIHLPTPPIDEQERIASLLYTVDEMIARTAELRDKYERLKRGLMQDLLSGEVRTTEDIEVLEGVKT